MKRKLLIILLIIIIATAIIFILPLLNTGKIKYSNEDDLPETAEQTVNEDPAEVDDLPVGKLIITPERRSYLDGSLTLYIPKLAVSVKVYDGTDSDNLRNGVGLYDYAQLPGEGNRNVSIAGHRNQIANGKIIDDAPFYYIDTMTDGDYLYLISSSNIYRYIFTDLYIVEEDDWSPIYTTGKSCLTITSCHPIGVSDHRIVLRAELDSINNYDENYLYHSNNKEE